ncbi:MAG: bifunctional phosphoribosylaminoimidazolecarboxamide formyltransferase/IMP cyclohydrolase [Acidobacteriia bacterium]|nr:bifunctional phosphoribosylaminoimidazolecarboxamide formyltransferase/IMP cyclohydrolase [Terriglobia bacterium]
MQTRISSALISVHDKTRLVDLARGLAAQGIRIVSTGGTAQMIRSASLAVRDVSEVTGSPEMLGGRVKTLHPHIHGALLADRNDPNHMRTLKERGIDPIDLVVVNLYPFESVTEQLGATPEELVENIDIGGVALLRAAAKNFRHVAVVVSPEQYGDVLLELERTGGHLSLGTRLHLARQAYEEVARYDAAIVEELSDWSGEEDSEGIKRHPREFPAIRFIGLHKVRELRYGENPHQRAAVYRSGREARSVIATAEPLQGKELSYNNLLDLDSAWRLSTEFDRPNAVIMKHNNPCGVASAETALAAYQLALACDPVSAYGSVLSFNRPVDQSLAEEVAKIFVEAIVAPGYSREAREVFSKKKNLRLIERASRPPDSSSPSDSSGSPPASRDIEFRQIDGGFLAQTGNTKLLDEPLIRVVSRRLPDDQEWQSLRFAWRVVKHVKSNAIVFSRGEQTLGIGAGQMSRVDAVKIAVMKAQHPLAGSVVASDAFFPFRDGVDEAAKAGATAVMQPGGSVRDEEVIAAADEKNLAMVFTGIRHFRH